MAPRSFSCSDIRNIDNLEFLDKLSSCDWNTFYDIDSIDDEVSMLNSHIFNTLDEFAPIRVIIVKKRTAPWISDGIRALMKRRDSTRFKLRRTGDLKLRTEFVFLRNKVNY